MANTHHKSNTKEKQQPKRELLKLNIHPEGCKRYADGYIPTLRHFQQHHSFPDLPDNCQSPTRLRTCNKHVENETHDRKTGTHSQLQRRKPLRKAESLSLFLSLSHTPAEILNLHLSFEKTGNPTRKSTLKFSVNS